MKTTEDLFRESTEQYQQLIQNIADLSSHMASSTPEEILKHCEELQEMQKKQAKLDKFIVEIMNDLGPQILETPYVGEYQRMLDNALQSCNEVAAKAKTLRALLHDEIQKLKKGQKGLAGYAAVTKKTKNNMSGHY